MLKYMDVNYILTITHSQLEGWIHNIAMMALKRTSYIRIATFLIKKK